MIEQNQTPKQLFGDAAVGLGFVSKQSVTSALDAQMTLRRSGKPVGPIGVILAEKGLLTTAQIAAVLRHMSSDHRALSADGIRLAARIKSMHAQGHHLIGIASTASGDASLLGCDIALALAVMEQSSVAIIDADTAAPQLHARFGVSSDMGWLERLRQNEASTSTTPWYENTGLTVAGIDGLVVIPLGSLGNDVGMLSVSAQAQTFLKHVKSQYKYAIVLLGDLMMRPETAVLAAQCDAVVLGVRAEETDRKQLTQAHTLLTNLGVPLTGVVLTHRPYSKGQQK